MEVRGAWSQSMGYTVIPVGSMELRTRPPQSHLTMFEHIWLEVLSVRSVESPRSISHNPSWLVTTRRIHGASDRTYTESLVKV